MAIVLASTSLIFNVCPVVEGSFEWLSISLVSWEWSSPEELSGMTLPEVCGTTWSESDFRNVIRNSSTLGHPPPHVLPEGRAITGIDSSATGW